MLTMRAHMEGTHALAYVACTAMLADAYVEMYEAGRITGRYKSIDKGKMAYIFAMGTQKLYDFLDNHPAAAIFPASYTNDPCVIGRNPKVVAINNAIEIDLFTQVSSEASGSRQISGTGDQLDFQEEGRHDRLTHRTDAVTRSNRHLSAFHRALRGDRVRLCADEGQVNLATC